jgi:hypothetical protein
MTIFLLLALSISQPAATPSPPPLSPDALYSRRALRRAKLLIQMRVMQFREERLECIRAALRRELPAALWPEVPSPARGTTDAEAAARHCEELLKF